MTRRQKGAWPETQVSLDALRERLAHLRGHWPAMPRPYDPTSPAAIKHRDQAQAHAEEIARVEAAITARACPVDLSARQERPLMPAPPHAPARLRR